MTAQSLPGGGHLLPVPHRPGWGERRGSRQDAREQQHDRPRGGQARAQAVRGAGGLQVVRRRPAGRAPRLRRRGERGRLVPAPRRHGVDHRQGRHHPRPCWRPRSPRGLARDPGELYRGAHRASSASRSTSASTRPATAEQKSDPRASSRRSRSRATELAGEQIQPMLTKAPGNGAPIGGAQGHHRDGWFAARPSGTEDVYKIYAESFRGREHLARIQEEAQAIVAEAFRAASGIGAA